MTEDPLLAILVLVPTFVVVSLVFSLVTGMKRFRAYRPILAVLIAPGIIMHEAGHYLACKIMRIDVVEVHLFGIDEYWNAGGSISTAPIENSFFKPLLVAVSPALINTSLACILILAYQYLIDQWIRLLVIWLVISLILSCRPSLCDLGTAFKSLVRYPRQSLREFGYLFLGIVFGASVYVASLIIIGVELPLSLVAIFSIVATAIVYKLIGGP